MNDEATPPDPETVLATLRVKICAIDLPPVEMTLGEAIEAGILRVEDFKVECPSARGGSCKLTIAGSPPTVRYDITGREREYAKALRDELIGWMLGDPLTSRSP